MIRKGTHDDVAAVVAMGATMHEQSAFRHVVYVPEKVSDFIHLHVDHGFFMVAEVDGKVVGGMLGDCMILWFTTDITGLEYAFYVQEENRNGLIAAKLVAEFIRWCKAAGAKQIRPAIATGNQALGRLYEAYGFKPVGNYYNLDC